eukprot:scaffold5357_cov150-Skeletonema_menzelii.AAC.12
MLLLVACSRDVARSNKRSGGGRGVRWTRRRGDRQVIYLGEARLNRPIKVYSVLLTSNAA